MVEPGIQPVNPCAPALLVASEPPQWLHVKQELALDLLCLENGAVTRFIPEGSPYKDGFTECSQDAHPQCSEKNKIHQPHFAGRKPEAQGA